MRKYHSNYDKRIILNLTRRGLLNLPVEVQKYLGTKPESQIQLILADGKAYLEPVTMSLGEVFDSIELAEPGKDLDQIIEEAKEEHIGRFLDIYAAKNSLDIQDALSIAHIQDQRHNRIYSYDTDFDAYPQITRIELL
jgi:bifunctional DNA-binding transcriptional regulator/antitoxin component of YhaV-PrlF toxin-antitoxin module